MRALIEIRGLVRRFGDATAIDGIDLDVAPGTILALLGHNGAGKTTLLRTVNGLLRPSAGTVRVFGDDPYRDGERTRARSGAVTESTNLDEFLTVRESLVAFGRMYGVGDDELTDRVDELADAFELTRHVDRPARELSAGMRQRAAFARALVHRPELLLLDEPTANLDPVAAHHVRLVVAELARGSGATVLISTHNLAEAQDICDEVVVMREGELVRRGTVAELAGGDGVARTRIEVASDPVAAELALAPFGDVRQLPDAGWLEVEHRDADEVADMVAALVTTGARVVAVHPATRTLEDVYLELHREVGA